MDELDKLVEEQFQILREANDKVRANAIAYHDKECSNHTKKCRERFIMIFLLALEARVRLAYTLPDTVLN